MSGQAARLEADLRVRLDADLRVWLESEAERRGTNKSTECRRVLAFHREWRRKGILWRLVQAFFGWRM